MKGSTGLIKAVALLGAGVLAGVAATQMHVSFGTSQASASPPATMQPSMPPPTPSQISDARAVSRTFQQVAEQLKPSVVAIVVEKGGRAGPAAHRFGRGPGGQGGPNPFGGTPFEHFFRFGDGEDGPDMGKQVGAGSGVVIDGRGYILTNNHVIDGADVIKVRFADGHEARGTVAGTDPKTDLAIVKVTEKNLVAAKFGDSDKLQPGEWVIAIGNPYGFDHTVTVGVISAKGRFGIGGGQYEDYLQTDAAINPGNSGGPLVNLDGEVIGINTAIKGIGTMIGFAIPTSMARQISAQLIDGGRVRRPYLGILMQDLSPELQRGLGGGAPDRGAIVSQLEEGSPAAKSGLQPGDVITRVDGHGVDGSKAVQRAVLSKALGQAVALEVWRGGKTLTLSAVTAENPSDKSEKRVAGNDAEGGPAERGKLGIQLQTLTPELAQRLNMPGARGAVVAGVRPDGPAAEAGLREDDIVVEVDRQKIGTADEAVKLLQAKREGGHLLRVKRGEGALYIVIPTT